MRLRVTHHAIQRMGEYHPEFADCVPKEPYVELDPAQADKIMVVLQRFVTGLERGSTVRPPEIECRKKVRKYGRLGIYIFDREPRDYYQMAFEHGQLILVTVTRLAKHFRAVMVTEPNPKVRFKDIEAIAMPYVLSPAASTPRMGSVLKLSGGRLPVAFNGGPVLESSEPTFEFGT